MSSSRTLLRKLRTSFTCIKPRFDPSIILLYIAASVEQYCDITQLNALPENEGILERAVRPDDLLFTGPNGKAYNFTVALRKLLIVTNLRTDANGRARSAYSLRHSFAMSRIMEPKLNLTHLAENIGTSVEIMATHYLSHINVVSMIDTLTADTRQSPHHYALDPESQQRAAGFAQQTMEAAGLTGSQATPEKVTRRTPAASPSNTT